MCAEFYIPGSNGLAYRAQKERHTDTWTLPKILTLLLTWEVKTLLLIISRSSCRKFSNYRNFLNCILLYYAQMLQGCDCAANWLILAKSDPNFVISEISVHQVRKCFPAWGVGVFTIQEQPCKCLNCRRFLRILTNFASGQFHPCVIDYYNF